MKKIVIRAEFDDVADYKDFTNQSVAKEEKQNDTCTCCGSTDINYVPYEHIGLDGIIYKIKQSYCTTCGFWSYFK